MARGPHESAEGDVGASAVRGVGHDARHDGGGEPVEPGRERRPAVGGEEDAAGDRAPPDGARAVARGGYGREVAARDGPGGGRGRGGGSAAEGVVGADAG